MKTVFYWSPCLNKVGTYKSTVNSALSISRYSKNDISIKIIDACGEWDEQKNFFQNYNIEIIDLGFDYFKNLPKFGFFKSRLSYSIIFLLSFFPLLRLLIKEKPDFIVVHLITSLPLVLVNILNIKTKCILRISGYPKLNFFRKFFWRLVQKKIFKVFCPSKELKSQLKKKNIFDEGKLIFLPDPIIWVKKMRQDLILSKDIPELKNKRKYFISVGRLTKQKNFIFLCKAFKKVVNKYPNAKLLIAGEGEDKEKINSYIIRNKLEENIITLGYIKNIFPLMYGAKLFILSSLWEDPGFVLIEASFCRTPTLTSNCETGPIELIKDKKNGLVFESNNLESFFKKYEEFNKIKKIFDLKLNNLKMIKKFTLFQHYKNFNKILSN